MVKDYDRRQLKLMCQKINDFKQNPVRLDWLVNDLEALLNVLQEKDENWEGKFRRKWLDLELVYSLFLDEERDYLKEEEIKMVNESIDQLSQLIELKLQKSRETCFPQC